jgi:hypothetical protein
MARATRECEESLDPGAGDITGVTNHQGGKRVVSRRIVILVCVDQKRPAGGSLDKLHPADTVQILFVAAGGPVQYRREHLHRLAGHVKLRQHRAGHQLGHGKLGDGLLVGVADDEQGGVGGIVLDGSLRVVEG